MNMSNLPLQNSTLGAFISVVGLRLEFLEMIVVDKKVTSEISPRLLKINLD
jgi:hypothetical protein